MSPTDYIDDCQSVFGIVIDHSSYTLAEIRTKQKSTQEIWETRQPRIKFDFLNEDNSAVNNLDQFQSRFKYDLIGACNRQRTFYYQVSLPHFKSEKYLELCLDRYKKFLWLKTQSNEFLVPCYAIDLIWHTHQLCPHAYAKDTSNLLHYVFPHDDSVNDRNVGSKLSRAGPGY